MGPRAQKKKALSVTELAGLESEKRELEGSLKQAEGYGEGTPGSQLDKGKIQAEIRHYENEIQAGTPGRLQAKTKDSLYREEKELESRFMEGQPTRYEMAHPGRCPGAVRKHLKWLERNEQSGAVARYREIQRSLRPGEERSIEDLRKDK